MIKMCSICIRPLIIGLIFFSYMYACSCLELPPPNQAYEEVDVVFSGEVISIDENWDNYYNQITIEVTNQWKGESLNIAKLLTEVNSAMCGYEFQINNNYLVYGYKGENNIYTNICTRTNLLEYANEDLDFLNGPSGCESGYSQVNGLCFYDDDMKFLQDLIDNSMNSGFDNCYSGNDSYCGSPNIYMDSQDAWFWKVIDGQEYNFSNGDGLVEPLELGIQEWENGRLTSLMCGAYIYCNLSGEVPSSVSNVSEIHTLRLEVNYFDGYIPESVCELENVDFNDYLSFDFSYNYLCPPYPQCVGNNATQYMQTDECTFIGDLNNDNEIDIVDIIILVNYILGTSSDIGGADINQDGAINVLDIITLVNIILE